MCCPSTLFAPFAPKTSRTARDNMCLLSGHYAIVRHSFGAKYVLVRRPIAYLFPSSSTLSLSVINHKIWRRFLTNNSGASLRLARYKLSSKKGITHSRGHNFPALRSSELAIGTSCKPPISRQRPTPSSGFRFDVVAKQLASGWGW